MKNRLQNGKDIYSALSEKLETRKASGTYRFLSHPEEEWIDFTSNDYLGLAAIPAAENYFPTAVKTGATGSRLLSGNHEYHEFLERYCADYFHAEECLLFNSGYLANLGLLSAVPQKGDVVLLDELSHICIKEGVRLSQARYFNFRHNDLDDLERKLNLHMGAKTIFVVVESVYSMDGDESPLEDLLSLRKHYPFEIIVDEAHTTALYEESGAGLCVEKNIQHEIFARVYTFGKAAGAHGAVVAGNQILKKFLINYSRPFIFTTAPAVETVNLILNHLEWRKQHPALLAEINHKVNLFRSRIADHVRLLQSHHPIQGVRVDGEDSVIEFSKYLNQKGFYTRPIVHPTVKKGAERVRVCLHTFNTDEQIIALALSINNYFNKENP